MDVVVVVVGIGTDVTRNSILMLFCNVCYGYLSQMGSATWQHYNTGSTERVIRYSEG